MRRRASATKKLNNSTDLDGQAATSKPSDHINANQPQHKAVTKQERLNDGEGRKSMSSAQNLGSGESNDTRVAPTVPQHRQPASQQQQRVFVNPIADRPREEQIRAVLEHRKLLLTRIRQSKIAAETRLARPSQRTFVAILDEANVASEENSDAKVATGDEVEAYQELTRLATQAAKKQRQEEQHPAEKRVSVSLRRGSFVGKRMSQALSVLTPGASDTATASEVRLVSAPPPVAIPIPPQPATSSMPTKKLKISASIGKQMNESKKRTSQKKSASRFNATIAQSYALPQTLAEPFPPPKQAVVFPEAVALRERRAVVRSKLSAILDAKQQRLEQVMKPKDAQRITALAKGGSILPFIFPKRRKTQWDYLLEEMRWLATDFVEERKWKATSGRVLSSAINSHHKEKSKKFDKVLAAVVVVASKSDNKPKLKKVIEDEKKDGDDEVTQDDVSAESEVKPQSEQKMLHWQRFVTPNEDDIAQLHANAKRMAGLISELWEGVLESGAEWQKLSSEVKEESGTKEGKSDAEPSSAHKAIQETTNKDVPKSGGNDDRKEKDKDIQHTEAITLPFDAIAERIDSLMARVDRRPRQRTRSKPSSSKVKLTISPFEQKASDFVEYIWKATKPAGAVIGDAYSFSSIDVAISLLRQRKKEGPHIVLCPPCRMLHWTSELERMNTTGRILCEDVDDRLKLDHLANSDIVVANLTSPRDGLDLSQFESVVLDVNVTLGSSRSISAKEVRDWIHPEVLSETWWNSFLRDLSSKNQRRLMIANSFVVKSGMDEAALLHRLTEKERLDCIAGMVSFVFGPTTFQAEKKSHLHRVLSWAKYQVKASKGLPKYRVKIHEIESHLVSLIRKLFFAPSEHFETVQHSFEEKAIFDTEIALCKMPPRQQAAYDTLCRSLRGALSLGGSLVDAARGFMQLREVCFHARLRDVCHVPCMGPSQPDLNRAVDIVSESAKLRELIVLLHRDLGYDIEGIEVLESQIPDLQPKSKRSKPLKDGISKVAIIASSPLVQRLTSILLSSLGIDHENLAENKSMKKSGSKILLEDSETAKGGKESCQILPWIERQLSLMRYNNNDEDPHGFPFPSKKELVTPRSANILLGSVLDIAAREQGLSVEASDIVIFMDEDWSGRECKLVKQILVRCFLHRARHEADRSDFRVYRFVCGNCCEEKLLCAFEDNDNTLELQKTKWAIDRSGLLQLVPSLEIHDDSFAHFDPDYVFEFPGRNLASFENQELALFLGSKEPLPANLESGKELNFLPFKKRSANQVREATSSTEMIMTFVRELIAEEVALRALAESLGMQSYGTAAPMSLTIRSMFVAQVRYYMQSFGRDGSANDTANGSLSIRDASSHFRYDAAASNSRDAGDNAKDDGKVLTANEVNAAILFYPAGESIGTNTKRKLGVQSTSVENHSGRTVDLRRVNFFAAGYSKAAAQASATARDGSQGCEPLAYFPPLFPSLVHIASSATNAVSQMRSYNKRRKVDSSEPAHIPESLKRPIDRISGSVDSKRPRIDILEPDGIPSFPKGSTASFTLPPGQLSVTRKPESVVIPSNLSSTQSSLLAPANARQFNGISMARSLDEVSHEVSKQTLMDLDEDFGILGVGALPIQSRFSSDDAIETVGLTDYNTISGGLATHDMLSSNLICDFEEAETGSKCNLNVNLGAMILFVPRKIPLMARHVHSVSPAVHSRMSPWNASMPSLHSGPYASGPIMIGMSGEIKTNGASTSKKIKKKSTTPTSFPGGSSAPPPGSVARPAAESSVNPQATPSLSSSSNNSKGKETLRYKILASHGRHGYGNPCLLESSNFRMASLQVRDRICDRVSSLISSGAAYSSQPLRRHIATNPWNAQVQSSSPPLWMSSVSPTGEMDSTTGLLGASKKADFGPFNVGNISSVAELTRFSRHKASLGLEPPMGVALPGEQGMTASSAWTLGEDKKLHKLALRFSMNWNLIASNLVNACKPPARSAKQCRERWHTLAKANTSLIDDMMEARLLDTAAAQLSKPMGDVTHEKPRYRRISLDVAKTSSDGELYTIPECLGPKLPSQDACLAPEQRSIPNDHKNNGNFPRKSFVAFRAASKKQHDIPMVIPGVVAGQKPSLAASHPSHHQSLQVAVAALSPGGRTEMWPLQILDLADKQKKSVSRQPAGARSPHRSAGSYQAAQPRHPPAQQPYALPSTQAKAAIPPKAP